MVTKYGFLEVPLSYVQVADHRQSEILKQLAIPQRNSENGINELAKVMMQQFREAGIKV